MEDPDEVPSVKGIPFIQKIHNVEAIEKMYDEFEVRDKDVIIMTYPKSGTHWMIDIISLIYSNGDPSWIKSVPAWKRFPWIEMKNGFELIKNKEDPRFLTSHLPVHLFPKSYFSSKAKMIYIARNPRDVIVSYYHFINPFALDSSWSAFENFFESFLRGNVYGSWFDHIKGWLSMRNSEKFLFLTYEELHQDLKVSVEKICRFLRKKLSEEEISSVLENASFQVMEKHRLENNESIEYLRRNQVVLMRKGICGEWKNYFTVAQMETFNKLYQEKMEGLDQDLFPWNQC
ncbi:bile salt sulfotransferase isoform X2 [Sarcophilus harrisii]|uniref:bile salt sulfotransferase isoform X2 n=1 Tax=Sarcophilus harrisii TaxID=9305 RepID=UPI000C797E08|nr:bile salt sulfotransferase isoform X2 [Sarcophilus harrisii]